MFSVPEAREAQTRIIELARRTPGWRNHLWRTAWRTAWQEWFGSDDWGQVTRFIERQKFFKNLDDGSDDLCQDVAEILMKKVLEGKYNSEKGTLLQYAIGIAGIHILKAYRSRLRSRMTLCFDVTPEDCDNDLDTLPDGRLQIEIQTTHSVIMAQLKRVLPSKQYKQLEMEVLYDMSGEEIAKELNVTPGNARLMQYRMRVNARRLLGL